MKRFVCGMAIYLFLNSFLLAQNGIQTAVNTFMKSEMFKNASVGVAIIDQNTGELVAGHNNNLALIPASSLKVLTTATMLELYGSDYQFKTEIQYDGTISPEGILNGNIYIKGYGDPSLGSHHVDAAEKIDVVLSKFAAAIQQAGIKEITGKIIGDGTYFSTRTNGDTWLWEDLGNYYGASVWGLNFHENLFQLTFQQNPKLGSIPKIKSIKPEVPNLMLVNELKSAERGTGDNAFIFNAPYSYSGFVHGTIPIGSKDFTVKGAVPDGPFFAAYHLMKKLESIQLKTSGWATTQFEENRLGIEQSERKSIYSYRSPKLSELVKATNLKSINLYCESYLRMIGKKQIGEGSAEAGLKAIYDYWEKQGLNLDFCFLEDGSGLSPRNGISPYQLAEVMRIVREKHTTFDAFYNSLPIAGQSGGLRYILKGSAAEGKLRAKSGGMARVRSYTGYAVTGSGQKLAFSMIANNFKGKSSAVRGKMESLMAAISR